MQKLIVGAFLSFVAFNIVVSGTYTRVCTHSCCNNSSYSGNCTRYLIITMHLSPPSLPPSLPPSSLSQLSVLMASIQAWKQNKLYTLLLVSLLGKPSHTRTHTHTVTHIAVIFKVLFRSLMLHCVKGFV